MVSGVLKIAIPAVQEADSAAGAALRLEGISHGFRLSNELLGVLQDVSLRVEPGEFVALLGPSGCGKSTLLRLVVGLDEPLRGRITIDGAPVDGPHPSRVVMFQDPTLFPWRTVWQNAALGLQARGELRLGRKHVDEVRDLGGLASFASAYPHQLSGGMAQRASLARALVNEPRLLLLDEPLGKLDSLTRLAMQSELTRLWQRRGFTVLMVTHDVEEALLMAGRVVMFSDRPARIRAELSVDLPYPRHRDDPELLRLRRDALSRLGLEAAW